MQQPQPIDATIEYRLTMLGQQRALQRGRSGAKDQSIKGKIQGADIEVFDVSLYGQLTPFQLRDERDEPIESFPAALELAHKQRKEQKR